MSSPSIIFNQIVEVSRPRLIKSPYSTELIEDHENPEWVPVDFLCSVQPNSSSEGSVERPTTVAGLVLITPPGTDIPELAADSRIRVGGVMELDVVGPPERWPDPWEPGIVHHLEAIVEVVHG